MTKKYTDMLSIKWKINVHYINSYWDMLTIKSKIVRHWKECMLNKKSNKLAICDHQLTETSDSSTKESSTELSPPQKSQQATPSLSSEWPHQGSCREAPASEPLLPVAQKCRPSLSRMTPSPLFRLLPKRIMTLSPSMI
jgi:hypothetical protein